MINSYQIQSQIHPAYILDAYQSQEDEKIAFRNPNLIQKNRVLEAIGNPISSRSQAILRIPLHSLASPESIQILTLPKTIQNQGIRVWFVLTKIEIVF